MGNPGRIPLQHPDYRYPESRNLYSGRLRELAGIIYSDNQTEIHQGHWREHFPDTASAAPRANENSRRALHVEIGCNGGHVVLKWATRDPAGAYIGIDWKFKQIFRGAEKAAKQGLKNIVFFRAHADRIGYMFEENEVDHLYLYFPDPWPRKSQWKNRFVTARNLKALARVTRPGGTFRIKTDHAGYFDWMEREVSLVGELWNVTARSTDIHEGNPNARLLDIPEVTLFEKIFIREGIRIHGLDLARTVTQTGLD